MHKFQPGPNRVKLFYCHEATTATFSFPYFPFLSISTGIKELRHAIAKFHEDVDGIKGISPDDIIVGPGTKQLSFLLLEVFNGGKFQMFFFNRHSVVARPGDHRLLGISSQC